MYVVCPSCQDVFKITSAHLAAAQGHVRCGGCHGVFDATASLYDSLEEAGQAVQRMRAAEHDIDDVVDVALAGIEDAPDADPDRPTTTAAPERLLEPSALTGVDSDCYAWPVAGELAPARVGSPAVPDVGSQSQLSEVLEDVDDTPSAISGKIWWGVAASVLLSVLITGQYIWKERYLLAANQGVRPWLERYCALLHCDLPLRSDVARIEILEREVRDHPRVKDALLVTATFVNEAPFVQSYPVFEISFSDVSGTPVSVRRFEPREYLPEATAVDKGLQPGNKTQLVLEVLDPGKKAVSFQLDFL